MAAAAASAEAAWHTQSPYAEVVGGVRAIVPLVIFLMIVLFIVLREKLPNAGIVVWGLFLSVVGMCIFSIGLTYGLAQLGAGTGGLVPGLFVDMDDSLMPAAPLYNAGDRYCDNGSILLLLGFGATLAEPALNALGLTVQDLTNGSFKKSMLMYSVSRSCCRDNAGYNEAYFWLQHFIYPRSWLYFGSCAYVFVYGRVCQRRLGQCRSYNWANHGATCTRNGAWFRKGSWSS